MKAADLRNGIAHLWLHFSRPGSIAVAAIDMEMAMARRSLRRRESRDAGAFCIVAEIDRRERAASIAKGPAALLGSGDADRAFDTALDIEPVLYEAEHALQAAVMFRRMARER